MGQDSFQALTLWNLRFVHHWRRHPDSILGCHIGRIDHISYRNYSCCCCRSFGRRHPRRQRHFNRSPDSFGLSFDNFDHIHRNWRSFGPHHNSLCWGPWRSSGHPPTHHNTMVTIHNLITINQLLVNCQLSNCLHSHQRPSNLLFLLLLLFIHLYLQTIFLLLILSRL